MLPSTGMHQSIAELRDTNSYSQNPKGAAQHPQSQADLAPAWDLMLDESKSYRGPKFFRGTTSAASSSSLSSAQLPCWWFFFWLFVLIKHQSSGFPQYKGHGRMGCAGIWDWIAWVPSVKGCGGSLNTWRSWAEVYGAIRAGHPRH